LGCFDDLLAACAADDDPFTSITAYLETEELNESWGWGTDFRGGPSYSLEGLADRDSPYEQLSQEFRVGGSPFDDRMTWIPSVWFPRKRYPEITRAGVAWIGYTSSNTRSGALYYTPCALLGIPGCNTLGELAVGTQFAVSRRQETHAQPCNMLTVHLRFLKDFFSIIGLLRSKWCTQVPIR